MNQLLQDKEDGVVHITCGTNKLFRAQFNLESNKYTSHQDWKKDWVFARTQSFSAIGSKTETTGNVSCQATANLDGTFNFKLRLPRALEKEHGKYLEFKNIKFSYGNDIILAAINWNLERKARKEFEKKKPLLPSEKDKYKEMGVSISYVFKKDKKGWKIHLTTEMIKPTVWFSKKDIGVIGVDINIDHLAVIETDKYGNPITYRNIPLCTYGLSPNQALGLIGEKIKELVAWAKKVQKPIIIEKLEFKDKRNSLYKVYSKKQARMLSSFAYTKIITFIKSRAYREGVHTHQVNPAYTSLLGRCRPAMRRYGLTIHQAAALVIGRRFLKFSEKLPYPGYIKVPIGDGETLALRLPDRCPRRRGNVLRLRATQKSFKAALAAHYQAKCSRKPSKNSKNSQKSGRKTVRSCRTSSRKRSSSEDPQLVCASTGRTPLVVVGEIPAGESLSYAVEATSTQMVSSSGARVVCNR